MTMVYQQRRWNFVTPFMPCRRIAKKYGHNKVSVRLAQKRVFKWVSATFDQRNTFLQGYFRRQIIFSFKIYLFLILSIMNISYWQALIKFALLRRRDSNMSVSVHFSLLTVLQRQLRLGKIRQQMTLQCPQSVCTIRYFTPNC